MSKREKAKELVKIFGKELAIKVVDEIQEIKSVYHDDVLYDYWEEVKQEIKNLQHKREMSDWTYEIIEMSNSDSEWFVKAKDGVPSILKIKFQKECELDRIITYTFNDEQILNTTTFNTKER